MIAGPTASGKSSLGLRLAQAIGGEIVGADSMQLYRDLQVLTARPAREATLLAPHHLLGVADAADAWSVGRWLDAARQVLDDIALWRRPAIVVGGTGLYFKALTQGLSAVPPISPDVREAVRARLDRDGVEALHAELSRRDPLSAARLKPRDRTRIARALEVVEATGRSITDWHREGVPPLLPTGAFHALFLAPERDALYQRIDARFDAMLTGGALAEVERLAGRRLDPLLPAVKAHGVSPLIRHLTGEITIAEAAAIGRADTRHYAKRQFTWFRHQLPEFDWVKPEAVRGWFEERLRS